VTFTTLDYSSETIASSFIGMSQGGESNAIIPI